MNYLGKVLEALGRAFPVEVLREELLALVGRLEARVRASEAEWDDKLVLPVLGYARQLLTAEQGDEG